jgi:3-oxoacyl-[acyl-carrier-protein] synthase-3
VKILGTGSYLPPKVVTNDDLAKTLETSDEWIYSHTGIRARHVAEADDCTSTMAAKAARRALEAAGVTPEEIGLIIVATSTPDYNTFPSTACLVQDALGCPAAGAYDLQAACAGFIYALEQGRCWALAHPDRKVLVIGAETLTRVVDWTDRATCILFGDGAGAVVLGAEADEPAQPASHSLLGADGSGFGFITREGGTRIAPAPGQVPIPHLTLQGRAVFNFAVKTMDTVVRRLCETSGHGPGDLDRIFAHQANGRILEAVARRMELPMDKFFLNIETTGNTSAASVPVALDEAVRNGALKEGDRICLVGFGAGLTYGGLVMNWPTL